MGYRRQGAESGGRGRSRPTPGAPRPARLRPFRKARKRRGRAQRTEDREQRIAGDSVEDRQGGRQRNNQPGPWRSRASPEGGSESKCTPSGWAAICRRPFPGWGRRAGCLVFSCIARLPAGPEAGRTERGRSGCPGLLGDSRGLHSVPRKGTERGSGNAEKRLRLRRGRWGRTEGRCMEWTRSQAFLTNSRPLVPDLQPS